MQGNLHVVFMHADDFLMTYKKSNIAWKFRTKDSFNIKNLMQICQERGKFVENVHAKYKGKIWYRLKIWTLLLLSNLLINILWKESQKTIKKTFHPKFYICRYWRYWMLHFGSFSFNLSTLEPCIFFSEKCFLEQKKGYILSESLILT